MVAFPQYVAPGVYVTTQTTRQADSTTRHNICYMLGTGATGPENTITAVSDLTAFTDTFGASPSTDYVNQFFTLEGQNLRFINVTAVIPNSPTAAEIATALEAITENEEIGVLVAPEFFSDATRTDNEDVAKELAAAAKLRNCFVFLDPPVAIGTTVGTDDLTGVRGYANQLRAASVEVDYTALFFPYTASNKALSAQVAALATKKWSESLAGFPAGTQYPLLETPGIALTLADRVALTNNAIVPAITRQPYGTVLWGVRTLRDPALSSWLIQSQVVVNVLTLRLRTALEAMLFTPIKSVGAAFNKAKNLAVPVFYSIWSEGGLSGDTPSDGYSVIVDETNNTLEDVQVNGLLVVHAYITPAGAVEKVVIPIQIQLPS